MRREISIKFVDRSTGQEKREHIYASRFLFWMYNTKKGLFLTNLVFKQKWVSQFYGWLNKQKWSRKKIYSFVKNLDVNMKESILKVSDFRNFNEFFTRRINLALRPIRKESNCCVSPADGRIFAFQQIDGNTSFNIKNSVFNLRQFICDDKLADKYSGGSMIINRLYLSDYHHFHFPDSGVPSKSSIINGKYHAVSPYSMNRMIPFYHENHRMLTLFKSENFDQILCIEIGALTVGSIRQCYQPNTYVEKGMHKGYFELGGSTIVLLFLKGMIELDHDLCINTKQKMETYVRMGESIGKVTLNKETRE